MTREKRYKAIGFDMDGTLLDTDIDYEKLGNAEYHVMTNLGVPPEELDGITNDIEIIRKGVGWLNRNGNPITFDDACELVNQRASDVEMKSVETAKCFDGVPQLLMDLRDEGYPLGLLTRGQRLYAETAMRRCDILCMMDAIEAFDDHPTGEQKPNPIAMEYLAKALGVRCSEMLYVGDSVWDYYCARDSGADFIGISIGERGRAKWERIKDDIIIVDDIRDILKYL